MNLKLRYNIIDLSLKNPKIQELPGALPPGLFVVVYCLIITVRRVMQLHVSYCESFRLRKDTVTHTN
jgi:hypothetical protein